MYPVMFLRGIKKLNEMFWILKKKKWANINKLKLHSLKRETAYFPLVTLSGIYFHWNECMNWIGPPYRQVSRHKECLKKKMLISTTKKLIYKNKFPYFFYAWTRSSVDLKFPCNPHYCQQHGLRLFCFVYSQKYGKFTKTW